MGERGGQAEGVPTNQLPKFDEVYKLLRSNLKSINADELDRAAVKGLLEELPAQVSLVTNGLRSAEAALGRVAVFDHSFAYFRIAQVEDGLGEKFSTAWRELTATNKIKGLVLDLRFSGGDSYSAAAELADQFIGAERPLLNWGAGEASSKAKTNPLTIPLAVVINRQTAGAAEALAAILRENEVALLIGSATAGQASMFKEFPLENGQRLRIATAPVKLGNGKVLAALLPDITVPVGADDEKAWFQDAYKTVPRLSAASPVPDTNALSRAARTNQARHRLNEAELVRLQREGINPDADVVAKSPKDEVNRTMVNDPALARALDLLKGIAVVQQQRRKL